MDVKWRCRTSNFQPVCAGELGSTEEEIRSMFSRHTEKWSCQHGYHGYMESDGSPYIYLVQPLNPEDELNFER